MAAPLSERAYPVQAVERECWRPSELPESAQPEKIGLQRVLLTIILLPQAWQGCMFDVRCNVA